MRVSAPTKVILFGEHYVVYGAPALAMAVDVKRTIDFVEVPSPPSSLRESITILNPQYPDSEGIIYSDGTSTGSDHVKMHAAIYRDLFMKLSALRHRHFRATFLGERIFKGMGASAALGACLSLALYTAAGVNPSLEEIFRCAQLGDDVDHGGRSSGIDATTVVYGGMVVFTRDFEHDRYHFERSTISLPPHTSFLLIDTFAGSRVTTADMVQRFAQFHGISQKPHQLSAETRRRIIAPYLPLYEEASELLRKGSSPERIGELMNEQHALLARAGLSTPRMEKARSLVLEEGGFGVKITGAGGEGGALLALIPDRERAHITNVLASHAFETLPVRPTNDTVRAEAP